MQLLHKRRWLPYIKFVSRIGIGIVAVFLLVGIIWIGRIALKHRLTPLFFWRIATGSTQTIKQADGRINLVLLGVGGQGHEGGELTDTIMVVSVGLETRDVVLISVPRDIWVPSLKDKINAAYELGETKTPGGGFVLAKATVEEVVGLPIHDALLIDFTGFKKIVDTMGGIDVNVRETFTDPNYPILGKENATCDGDTTYACRYETIVFTKGKEHMDGERALKYARSRHAEGDAGTDFSRGSRQQAVMVALKNKLLSPKIWGNFTTLRQLLITTRQAVRTDMPLDQLLLLGRILPKVTKTIRSIALVQDEPEKGIAGLLINPPQSQYDGKWVLVPKQGDFGQIGKYITCVVNDARACEKFVE